MRSASPRNALCAFRFYIVGVAISGGSFVVCVQNYLSIWTQRTFVELLYTILYAHQKRLKWMGLLCHIFAAVYVKCSNIKYPFVRIKSYIYAYISKCI